MLTEVFAEVYEKFKLNLYKHMFVNGGGKEHELTATETFTPRGYSCDEEP